MDVAIITVGGFAQADDYPEAIVRHLRPHHVILAHWEDFFRDPAKRPKVVRGTNIKKLISRLEAALPGGAGWVLPAPGVTLTFDVCRGASSRSYQSTPQGGPR